MAVNCIREAFKLFDQGKIPSSPEVKDLPVRPSTRRNYYYRWLRKQKPRPEEAPPVAASAIEESPDVIKQSGQLPSDGTIIPKELGKVMSEDDIAREIKEEKEEKREPKTISSKPAGVLELAGSGDKGRDGGRDEPPGGDGNEPPDDGEDGNGKEKENTPKGGDLTTVVYGSGIKLVVDLSIKTIALYQHAATEHIRRGNKKPLKLGDFLDDCVEDFYRGRNLDLGLVEIGGEKEDA